MSDAYIWDGISEVPQDVVDVIIAEGVRDIPDCTFATRKYLQSVILPSSLRTIGNFAFVDCDVLQSIFIPEGVAIIGLGAFSFCSGLESIKVSSENINYSSQNGVLYNKDKTLLIQYAVAREDTTITFLSTVKYIGDYAFNNCKSIETIQFHDDIVTIGNNAFNGCTNLRSVTIPSGVQSIGAYTFYGCTSLQGVTLPKSVESIGTYAFGYSDLHKKNADFYIRGYDNTEAKNYATECEFKFITLFEAVPAAKIEWADGKSTHTLSVGDFLELKVNVLPSDEDAEQGKEVTDKTVKWSTSNTAIATVVNGIVKGVSVGKVTITATTADGEHSVTCTVTTVIPVTAVVLDQTSISAKPGNVINISATLEPTNTTSRSLVWTSSDPSIAEIIHQEQTEYDDLSMYKCKVVPKLPGSVTIKAASKGNSVYSTCELTVLDPGTNDPQILVKASAGGQTQGSTYSVQLLLRNNPGIVGMNLRVLYDSTYLKLASQSSVVDERVLGNFYPSNKLSSNPYYLCWANDTRDENIEVGSDTDALIVTLQFKLTKTLSKVTKFPISVFYDSDNLDIYNADSAAVDFSVVNSSIKAADVTYGDVNKDGKVNANDVTELIQYLANYSGIGTFNAAAADVNSDDRITHRDQLILARHVDASQTYAVTEPLKQNVKTNTVVTLNSSTDEQIAMTQAAMDKVKITIVKDNKTVTLTKGKDYTLAFTPDNASTQADESKYTITFKKGTYITDTETEASIYYQIWSHWHNGGYDTLPLNS